MQAVACCVEVRFIVPVLHHLVSLLFLDDIEDILAGLSAGPSFAGKCIFGFPVFCYVPQHCALLRCLAVLEKYVKDCVPVRKERGYSQ